MSIQCAQFRDYIFATLHGNILTTILSITCRCRQHSMTSSSGESLEHMMSSKEDGEKLLLNSWPPLT